ncbi:MAG: hypothetical protein WCC22_08695 [Terriglobales bacterium]
MRTKLGIRQIVLAWDCQIDPTLISRFENGVYKLRPMQVDAITSYLAKHLLAAKEEFAALELPELNRAIEQVTR